MVTSTQATQATQATPSPQARAWIAIGLAFVATAAVMFDKGAVASPTAAAPQAVALPSQVSDLSAQVNWTKVAFANVTPAESVAAYDR